MLTLLSLLQTRRDWPGRVLAERLEVSDRTLRRDVDRLREMGYRIRAIKGPDGGYRLDAGSELPPLLFDDDQAVALAVALQAASATGAGVGEAALRALTTVRQVMPSRLRHRIDGVAFTTLPSAGAARTVEPDVLLAASAAVRANEVLRFDYTPVDRPAAEEGERRRIEPFKGADRGDAWPCVGEVVLELPARKVTPFVPDGIVEELAPGRCRLVAGSWSWIALAASIGRFDAAISGVAPPQLSDAFALLARRFADAGENPP